MDLSVMSFEFYAKAREIAPQLGISYKSIASIMHVNGNFFLSLYYTLRSMCVEVPYTNREKLVDLFETAKEAAGALETVNVLGGLSFAEHKHRFQVHFLACTGIAKTRVNVDHFMYHLDFVKKHLALMLQLLQSSSPRIKQSESAKNEKNSAFYEFSGQQAEKGDVLNLNIRNLKKESRDFARQVDEQLYQCLVITFSLLHIVETQPNGDGESLPDLVRGLCSKYNALSSSPDASPENLQRCFSSELFKVQCVSGLFDLLSLLFHIMSVLTGGDMRHLSEEARSLRTLATSRSVSVFLVWLENRTIFWCFSLLDRTLWMQLESSLNHYVQSFPSFNKAADNISVKCFEDFDLIAFLPLLGCFYNRSSLAQWNADHDDVLNFDAVIQRLERCLITLRRLATIDLCLLPFQREIPSLYFDLNANPIASAADSSVERLPVLLIARTSKCARNLQKEVMVETSRADTSYIGEGVDEEYCSSLSEEESPLLSSQESQMISQRGILNINAAALRAKGTKTSKAKKHANNGKANTAALKSEVKALPLIVIDAANVAMRHGMKDKFSCRGIALAIQFFQSAGHKVIAFLPDHYLGFERVGELRRMATLKVGPEVRKAQIPDNIPLLLELVFTSYNAVNFELK